MLNATGVMNKPTRPKVFLKGLCLWGMKNHISPGLLYMLSLKMYGFFSYAEFAGWLTSRGTMSGTVG